jgi:Rod binding domain-containing protein
MNVISIGPASDASPRVSDSPARVLDAAQQFEALLIGQMLRAARESGGGFTGAKDGASDCATEFAEQQFATVMARQGGLGLATLIGKGLGPAAVKP